NTRFAFDGMFNQSTYTPLEIMVRMRSGTNQAFRARVEGMAWHADRTEGDERLKTHQSQYALALGYEWYQPFNSRFGFYYGADLKKGWDNYNRTYNYTTYDSHYGDILLETFHFIKKPTVGLLPLVGFTYSPLP